MDRETAIKKLDELRDAMLEKLPVQNAVSRRSVSLLMDNARDLHLSTLYDEGFEVKEDFDVIEGCDGPRYIGWVSGVLRHIRDSEIIVGIYKEFK